MTAPAIKNQGTTLEVEISTFQQILGLTNITPGSFILGERDVTELESVSMEQDPTLGKAGPVTADVKINHDDTVHAQLLADMVTDPPTKRDYRITLSDGTVIAFEAWPSFTPAQMTPGGHRSAQFSFQPTGVYTITPPA